MRRWTTALIVLGMASAGVVAAAPGAVAANPGCLVTDANSNQSYPSLQAAVNAAAAGDTLFVRGTCTGVTVVPVNLTITGPATIGELVADSLTVTLNKLVITGIEDRLATLTLNDSIVTKATLGTGIENASGTVTLNNSIVIDNTATAALSAGGIDNIDGTVIMNGISSVAGNTGTFGGVQNGGPQSTLIMNGSSSIIGNTDSGGGGGIFNNRGTVTLNDSSSIIGNKTTGEFGGGIDNLAGTVTLNGHSKIVGNVAGSTGVTGEGGILNGCGTLHGAVAPPAAGANVFGNSPDNIESMTC